MRTINLFLFVLLFSVPGIAQEAAPMIKTSGFGQMRVAPDTAFVSVHVQKFDKEYRSASQSVQKKANKFVKGMSKEDPNHVAVGEEHITPNGSGYSVLRTIVVRLTDLQKVHGITQYLADRGARFWVTYSHSDIERLKRVVEKEAMKDARNKAFALAEIAGATLGMPKAISPTNTNVNPPSSSRFEEGTTGEAAYQTGLIYIYHTVHASFELKKRGRARVRQ